MKIHTFIADSAPEAVAQIRAQLGPEAVVLNVRKIEASGIGKLWKKPQIEVLAHLPETPEPASAADPLQALVDLRREISELKQQMPVAAAASAQGDRLKAELHTISSTSVFVPEPQVVLSRVDYGEWKVGNFLEQGGVLPRNVQRIVDCIVEEHGANAPVEIGKQLDLARAAVLRISSESLVTSAATKSCVHVFVGAAGAGKTTVLSKMLAQRVLLENLPARVFRLDGLRANTAESLSVYCEILGVPVERCRAEVFQTETTFVDLPGVNVGDADALKALANQIVAFRGAQVHLVLNAAYETNTLLNQLRAFSVLPISDIIFTHLDEEQRWGKMLNFCFGMKAPISYLSAGQNVPGELTAATIEKIVSRVIPSK